LFSDCLKPVGPTSGRILPPRLHPSKAIVAVAKIVCSLWQALTGDIRVLDGLKKIGP